MPSIDEITRTVITKRLKVVEVELAVSSKSSLEASRVRSDVEKELGLPDGQMTLWDTLQEKQFV